MIKLALVAVLISSVLYINSQSAHAQCDPKADACAAPKEPSSWDKSLAFGFNMTQGNTETTLLNIAGKAAYDYQGEIYDFGMSYNYGEDKAREDGGQDKVSRNDYRANGSYN